MFYGLNNFAKKYLRKIWKENPHPEYKKLIINLSENLGIEISELAKFITSSNQQIYESQVLLIESLILNKKWSEARNQIKSLIDVKPKKEVCLLMSKIEEGDTGDVQKINAWNLRSKQGKESNIWVCLISSKTQNEWSSISEGGYFNSLEWKAPIMLNQFNESRGVLTYED